MKENKVQRRGFVFSIRVTTFLKAYGVEEQQWLPDWPLS